MKRSQLCVILFDESARQNAVSRGPDCSNNPPPLLKLVTAQREIVVLCEGQVGYHTSGGPEDLLFIGTGFVGLHSFMRRLDC